MKAIPNGSPVVFIFGEIDCREGLLGEGGGESWGQGRGQGEGGSGGQSQGYGQCQGQGERVAVGSG